MGDKEKKKAYGTGPNGEYYYWLENETADTPNWIRSVHDAPAGKTVYTYNAAEKTFDPLDVKSNGSGYKPPAPKTDGTKKSETSTVRKTTPTVSPAEKQKKYAEGKSFSDYATQDSFNHSDSTADYLVQKAREENLSPREVKEAISSTGWGTSDKVKTGLKSLYDDGDADDEELNEAFVDARKNGNAPNWKTFKESFTDEARNNFKAEKEARRVAEEERIKKETEEKEKKAKELSQTLSASEESQINKLNKENKNLEDLDNEPGILKSVVNDKSLTWKERVSRLAELILSVGTNAALGAAAGIRGGTATPVQGKFQQMYNEAFKEAAKRKQERLNAENDSKKEQSERLGKIKTSTTLSKLNEKSQNELAIILGSALIPKEDFYKRFRKENLILEDDDTLEKAYSDYKNLHDTYGKGLEYQSKVLGLGITYQELARAQMQTVEEAEQYIRGIDNDIRTLETAKKDLIREGATREDFYKAASNVLNVYAGIETVSNSISSSSSGSSSKGSTDSSSSQANASAGVGGYVSVGASTTSSSGKTASDTMSRSNGSVSGANADRLRKLKIPVAEEAGNAALKDTAEARKAVIAAIDTQIESLKQMRSDAMIRKDKLQSGVTSSDLRMKDVKRCSEVQQRLGFKGGRINKKMSYYIKKLKGEL